MIEVLRNGRTFSRQGRLCALLAIAVVLLRLIAAPMPMQAGFDPAQALAMAQAAAWGEPICHADPGLGSGQPADPASGHAHDCGLCPLCHALADPVLLAGAVGYGGRSLPAAAVRVAMARATGPPQRRNAAAGPRGPPTGSI